MSFISRYRKYLIDQKSEEIFNTVVQNAKDIQEKLQKINISEGQIKLLKEGYSDSIKTLDLIKFHKGRKSIQGKLEINELHNISVRAKRILELQLFGESENNTITISELFNFIDRIRTTKVHIENLPYPYPGITVVGFIFSIIPFLNILSIIFGGYLAFSDDNRARRNGILMLIVCIIMILFAILIQ